MELRCREPETFYLVGFCFLKKTKRMRVVEVSEVRRNKRRYENKLLGECACYPEGLSREDECSREMSS